MDVESNPRGWARTSLSARAPRPRTADMQRGWMRESFPANDQKRPLCDTRPEWRVANTSVRTVLELGMRPWLHVRYNGTQNVVYFFTPKAAHGTIQLLLQKPPFRYVGHVNPGYDTMGRGFSGKGQCNMTCQKISRSRLQKLERDGALFFTLSVTRSRTLYRRPAN